MDAPAGIDPRGPRFAATITSVLLMVATFLALVGISTARLPGTWLAISPTSDFAVGAGDAWAIASATFAQRALDPGFLMTLVIALLFLWTAVSPQSAPWGVTFRTLVGPRLSPPATLEDPRPPRFSQGVGLFVLGVGLMLHLVGLPWALPISTAAAFMAAFLNAAFAFCLGCQIYLFLQRLGVIGRPTPAA